MRRLRATGRTEPSCIFINLSRFNFMSQPVCHQSDDIAPVI